MKTGLLFTLVLAGLPLAGCSLCTSAPPAGESGSYLVNTNGAGVALDGHDPVAFFTDGKPVMGSKSRQVRFGGATYWFASDEHIPNAGMLTKAAQSWMVATGFPSTRTCVAGSTLSEAGATPNEQVMVAVDVTSGAGMPPTLRTELLRRGRLAADSARPGSRECPGGAP